MEFDDRLDSVCDFSKQAQEGTVQPLHLFAYCIVRGQTAPPYADQCVPVRLAISGPEQPVVMLPNKTGLPAEKLLARGAYVTVDAL